jgi:hypothetical protein
MSPIVRIDGKDHSCGVYAAPAAEQIYARLIAEWILRGRQPAPFRLLGRVSLA